MLIGYARVSTDVKAYLCSATRLTKQAASGFLPIKRAARSLKDPVLLARYPICEKAIRSSSGSLID
jgi:hypothetical protein